MRLETGVVSGWEIKKNKDGEQPVRLLQVIISDPEDVQTVEWMGKPGEDDGLVAGMTVLIGTVGSTKFAFAADDGLEPDAGGNEKKIYSSENGVKSAEINLRKNGDIEIKSKTGASVNLKTSGEIELNGNTDFVISFTQLQTLLTQFALDINTELTKRELLPAQTPIPVTIDITPAKMENIKIGF